MCSDQADFSHHQCQRARVQSLSGEVSFHNNNNNNEVFERSFSIEPKAHTANNQTKRRKVPDTKYSHAAHTNVSLTSPSLHLHTHTHTRTCTHTCTHTHTCSHMHTHECTHTHTCAHICPRLLKACSRELKSIGAGDREKVSLELTFEDRQSLSMSHRKKGDCSRWKDQLFQMEGSMKEKACCPWNLLRLFEIRKKRVSAEEQRVRDAVYSPRRSDRYGGAACCSNL